jgi:hypothetical protein
MAIIFVGEEELSLIRHSLPKGSREKITGKG